MIKCLADKLGLIMCSIKANSLYYNYQFLKSEGEKKFRKEDVLNRIAQNLLT